MYCREVVLTPRGGHAKAGMLFITNSNTTDPSPFSSLSTGVLLFVHYAPVTRSLLSSSHLPCSFFALRLFHKILLSRKFFPSTHGWLLALSLIMVNITSLRRPQRAQNRLRPSITTTFFSLYPIAFDVQLTPQQAEASGGKNLLLILVTILSPVSSTVFVTYSALNKSMWSAWII